MVVSHQSSTIFSVEKNVIRFLTCGGEREGRERSTLICGAIEFEKNHCCRKFCWDKNSYPDFVISRAIRAIGVDLLNIDLFRSRSTRSRDGGGGGGSVNSSSVWLDMVNGATMCLKIDRKNLSAGVSRVGTKGAPLEHPSKNQKSARESSVQRG